MTREEVIERLTEIIAEEAGWDHPNDVAIARQDAEMVVDALIDLGVLMVVVS